MRVIQSGQSEEQSVDTSCKTVSYPASCCSCWPWQIVHQTSHSQYFTLLCSKNAGYLHVIRTQCFCMALHLLKTVYQKLWPGHFSSLIFTASLLSYVAATVSAGQYFTSHNSKAQFACTCAMLLYVALHDELCVACECILLQLACPAASAQSFMVNTGKLYILFLCHLLRLCMFACVEHLTSVACRTHSVHVSTECC